MRITKTFVHLSKDSAIPAAKTWFSPRRLPGGGCSSRRPRISNGGLRLSEWPDNTKATTHSEWSLRLGGPSRRGITGRRAQCQEKSQEGPRGHRDGTTGPPRNPHANPTPHLQCKAPAFLRPTCSHGAEQANYPCLRRAKGRVPRKGRRKGTGESRLSPCFSAVSVLAVHSFTSDHKPLGLSFQSLSRPPWEGLSPASDKPTT